MNRKDIVELYVLKCASLKLAVEALGVSASPTARSESAGREASLSPFISQFPGSTRHDAEKMAEYYKLFYMLENDMRKLIQDTLAEKHGDDWWDEHAPGSSKEECKANQQREREAGVTARSDNPLDYVSFGQLGEIMRAHWTLFGGILSNQKALGRVMFGLNMLRGPIAHCGILAEDEVDRLNLAVKDWFRLLEGPK